ncbi:MAG: MBL fold metallo-hydrolase [Balneolaceae bacterium]|nr:MBL fold metallo-hydrolase [Balneolaceae bacterium]
MKNLVFLSFLLLATLLGTCAHAQTNDTYSTQQGDLTVHPVNHGSIAFTFDGKTIFVDPFGGAELYSEFGAPDIIFITHTHGDHLDPETLNALNTDNTIFVVPMAVVEQLDVPHQKIVVIQNGNSTQVMRIPVSAIPMYNLPEDDPDSRHPKGRGNGYVIDFGGQKVYISGDTEDIPEMRALEGIDIAFVCMNLPYTMDINQAADAVIEFQPAVVYPYHHRGQDIREFKNLVDAAGVDVEVKLRDWYPE